MQNAFSDPLTPKGLVQVARTLVGTADGDQGGNGSNCLSNCTNYLTSLAVALKGTEGET